MPNNKTDSRAGPSEPGWSKVTPSGTPNVPGRMDDSVHGKTDSIGHTLPESKGENPRDYPQIPPNPSAKEGSRTYERAVPHMGSHGSAAHGDRGTARGNVSAGGPVPSPSSRNVGYAGPDPSCGIKRGGRGASG